MTVTALVGDAGIDSLDFQILLLVSLVTTLAELSIMYPTRALGRTHSKNSHLVQISYTVVRRGKMQHISQNPLWKPQSSTEGIGFSIARLISHVTALYWKYIYYIHTSLNARYVARFITCKRKPKFISSFYRLQKETSNPSSDLLKLPLSKNYFDAKCNYSKGIEMSLSVFAGSHYWLIVESILLSSNKQISSVCSSRSVSVRDLVAFERGVAVFNFEVFFVIFHLLTCSKTSVIV